MNEFYTIAVPEWADSLARLTDCTQYVAKLANEQDYSTAFRMLKHMSTLLGDVSVSLALLQEGEKCRDLVRELVKENVIVSPLDVLNL